MPVTQNRDVIVHGNNVVVPVNAFKLDQLREHFRERQSFLYALIGGLFLGAVVSLFWGLIIGMTGLQYELEWVPIVGIGFVVGISVRYCGKGIDVDFAILGAVLALGFSILINLYATVFTMQSQMLAVRNFMHISASFDIWKRVVLANITWVDAVTLAFSVWEGWALARWRPNPTQLATLAPRGELP